MKILIDTQVLVWLVSAQSPLGKTALSLVQDTTNQIYLSYLSLFELTIKASIGKLAFNSSIVDDLPAMGIEVLPLNHALLQNYRIYNPANKDPFDNALITTAHNEHCSLMTSDTHILATKVAGMQCIDARR